MTPERSEPQPRTEAGMMLRAIFPTRIGFSEQALTEHILAIEAEAAASPAAPAVDQLLEIAERYHSEHSIAGKPCRCDLCRELAVARRYALQDTVDPVAPPPPSEKKP